jgi:MFS transporter, DHA3 family, multidrug efflux protein
VFFFSGLLMVVLALIAFTTKSYRTLSAEYQQGPDSFDGNDERAAEDASADARVESPDQRR